MGNEATLPLGREPRETPAIVLRAARALFYVVATDWKHLRKGRQTQRSLLPKTLLMRVLNRNHEVDVTNTHRIGSNIDHFRDFDNAASKVFSEHGPDLDFLLPGTSAKPRTYLFGEHNEYLSQIAVYTSASSHTGRIKKPHASSEATINTRIRVSGP